MAGIQESCVGAVRDYRPSDLAAIKAIHDQTQIDYRFPDLNSPLFLVTKVYEVGGVVRAAGGVYIQLETYLWLDPSDWAEPDEKLDVIEALQIAGFRDSRLEGVDCAVLWIPPGMERFGKRLTDMGWTQDRDGWISFSRSLHG